MTFEEKLNRRMLYSHVRIEEAPVTLAEYLAAHFRRFDLKGWEQAVLSGAVQVNGGAVDNPAQMLRRHDRVAYFPGDLPEPPADLRYTVVHEDDDLLVIDKSGDLCVHPAGPFFRNTLWHLLGSRYGEVRFVNRLDRETSGLLVAARTPFAAAAMTAPDFAVRKEYLALVEGRFPAELRATGYLEPDRASIVFKKRRFVRSATSPEAEAADTEFRSEGAVGEDRTLVRAILHTGRQHQIRATLFSLGYPLAGDKLYGRDERIFLKIKTQTISAADRALLGMDRQALHSALLAFRHPRTGEALRFESPAPFL